MNTFHLSIAFIVFISTIPSIHFGMEWQKKELINFLVEQWEQLEKDNSNYAATSKEEAQYIFTVIPFVTIAEFLDQEKDNDTLSIAQAPYDLLPSNPLPVASTKFNFDMEWKIHSIESAALKRFSIPSTHVNREYYSSILSYLQQQQLLEQQSSYTHQQDTIKSNIYALKAAIERMHADTQK